MSRTLVRPRPFLRSTTERSKGVTTFWVLPRPALRLEDGNQ